MAWENGEINTAVGWGDISHATGIGGPPYTMGNMVDASGSYNKMCIYKPVRHSSPGWLTLAQIREARYGFYDPIHNLPASNPTFAPGLSGPPKNNWEYLKPRGISYNEWFRSTDFLSAAGSTVGYNANMGCPVFVESNGTPKYAGDFGVMLWLNEYAATKYSGKTWNANEGLTVVDLLKYPSRQDISEKYVAIVLYDNTDNSFNIIKTNTRIDSITGSPAYHTFPLLHAQQTIDGVTYPAIPFLNEASHSGHDITIIVGLMTGAPASGTYQIYTSAQDIYSLGIQDGCDRCVVPFGSSRSILGLTGGIINTAQHPITIGNKAEVSYGGATWTRYQITSSSIWGNFSAPSDGWGDRTAVYYELQVDNLAGFFGTVSAPGQTSRLSYGTDHSSGALSFLLSSGQTDQQRQLLGSIGEYLWFQDGVPLYARGIKIDIMAYAIDTAETKQLTGLSVYATS